MKNLSTTSFVWTIISFLIIYFPSYTIVNGTDVFTIYYYEPVHLIILIPLLWNSFFLHPDLRKIIGLPNIGVEGATFVINIIFIFINLYPLFLNMVVGFRSSETPNLLIIFSVNILLSILISVNIYNEGNKETEENKPTE